MENILTTSNIMFAVGMISLLFTIYNYFKNPQTKIEKDQIKTEEDLKDKATILSQKEVESKAQLLAQQFQWEKEANEKKFTEVCKNIENAFNLASNHTHTVDVKVDKLIEQVNGMGLSVKELSTIINERIPKKNE